VGKPKKIEVGDVFSTNDGGRVVVLRYRSASEVVVKHMDKRRHEANYYKDRLNVRVYNYLSTWVLKNSISAS